MVTKEKEKSIINETKMLIDMFLDTNLSDIELSKICGLTSSTVGRRLSNKKYIDIVLSGSDITYEDIKEKRQNNLKNAKICGGVNSHLNTINSYDLAKIFPDWNEKKQINFLALASLTFRLHLDSIYKIFKLSESELIVKFHKYTPSLKEPLNYLFKIDNKNQELAMASFLDYLKDLANAHIKRNKTHEKELLNKINDSQVLEIFKNIKSIEINENVIREILNYQLKYAINSKKLINYINMNILEYEDYLTIVFNKSFELKDAYILLNSEREEKVYG